MGVMKAVILSINPNANIVDISHEIAPQNIESASFLFNAAHGSFPPGTVHLIVVDPGVGSQRRGVLVHAEDCCIVAPDNGVLTEAISTRLFQTISLENSSYFLPKISNTFHGRDIFAPVAAHLSSGTPVSEFGPSVTDLVRVPGSPPRITNDRMLGQVRYIDRFGNLITNFGDDLFRNFCGKRAFEIRIQGRTIRRLCQCYSESEEESVIAVFNSFNLLELACYKRNAADELGACIGTPVEIEILA